MVDREFTHFLAGLHQHIRIVRACAFGMPVDQVEFVPAQLGNDSGAIGVACLDTNVA